MSWEDQGRQFHQWFGHGTAGGVADVGAGAGSGSGGARDVAGAVGSAAIAALGGARGRALAGVLAAGGAQDLADALPIWVAASGLAAERFRALVVGPGFGVTGVASLQAMARGLARAGEGGVSKNEVVAAGAQLAAALQGERQGEWGYKLNYARDMADYAAANGGVLGGTSLVLAKQPQVQAVAANSDAGSVQTVQYAVPGIPFAPPVPLQAIPGRARTSA